MFDVSRSGHARLAPDVCEARKCSFIVEIARPNALPFSFAPAAVFGPTEFTDGAVAAPTDLLPAGCSATRSVICSGRTASSSFASPAALAAAPGSPRGPLSVQVQTLHEVFVQESAPIPVAWIWKHRPDLSSSWNHKCIASW